jgi:hypothetical protein
MSTLAKNFEAIATDVTCDNDSLIITLADGREISVPLEWYPRLRDDTPAQRAKWRLIGGGVGIHWPEIDEDIEVEGVLGK